MATEVVEVCDGKSTQEDLAYWQHLLCPIIGSLLKSTGSYSPADQHEQLRILSEYVIPNLGPRPSAAHTTSLITQTGVPVQPSVNLSNSGKPQVRYCWELLGSRGGSNSDPLAIEAAREILPFLSTTLGFCTRWMDPFCSAFALTREEAELVPDMIVKWLKSFGPDAPIPQVKRLQFCFTAFDLKGPKVSVKTYICPKMKSMATGIPTNELMWSVIRNLEPSFNPDLLDTLEQFLAEHSNSAVELVGIDCVDEASLSTARIKIYISSGNNSFNTVRDFITLGGRFENRTIVDGLAVLRDIWHLLLQEPEAVDDDDYNITPPNNSPMRLYVSFEIRPDMERPEVKIYLPIWSYVRSDAEAIKNYEEVFRRCGYEWGKEGMYRDVFESAFGPATHNREKPVHCDASFMYSEDRGIYQTIYFSPPVAAEDK